MKLIVPAFVLATATSALRADSFSTIYSFGDSLSDAGNIYALSGGTIPGAPYVGGHFSNGNVWVQDLSASLGLGPVKASLQGGNDYAFGGATSGAIPGVHAANAFDLTSVGGQIAQFSAVHATADPNALYTIWIGSNDLADILATFPSTATATAEAGAVVANVDSAIDSLAGKGAKNFLVVTVPDLGLIPGTIAEGPAAQLAASALSAGFDKALVNSLPYTTAPKISVLNTYSLLDGVIADAAAYGFTNVTRPCVTGANALYQGGTACASTLAAQDQYLFWDKMHPTAAGHALLGEAALSVVTPEPATYAMLSFGLLGLSLLRRRSS